VLAAKRFSVSLASADTLLGKLEAQIGHSSVICQTFPPKVMHARICRFPHFSTLQKYSHLPESRAKTRSTKFAHQIFGVAIFLMRENGSRLSTDCEQSMEIFDDFQQLFNDLHQICANFETFCRF